MRFVFSYLVLLITLSSVPFNLYCKPAGIAARVNKQVITLQELENRIWFAKKFHPESEKLSKKSLIYNILDELIEEEMINQEAQRVSLSINEQELSSVIEQVKHGQTNLQKKIKQSKNPKLANAILESKIRSNLIWSKILSEIVKPSIQNINKSQIIETLEQLDRNTKEYKFNISQISILKSPTNKIIINKIYQELISDQETSQILEEYKKQDILFNFLDIGWVSKSSLDQNIYQTLIKNNESKYTKPILIGNNYTIFKINKKVLSNNISDQDYKIAQSKIYNSLKISDGKGFLRNLKRRTFIEIYRDRIDQYMNL